VYPLGLRVDVTKLYWIGTARARSETMEKIKDTKSMAFIRAGVFFTVYHNRNIYVDVFALERTNIQKPDAQQLSHLLL